MATALGQSGSGQDQEETCAAVHAGFDLEYLCGMFFLFSCFLDLTTLLIFVGKAFTCHVREVSSHKCSLIPFVDKRRKYQLEAVPDTEWCQKLVFEKSEFVQIFL